MTTFRRRYRHASRRFVAALESLPDRAAPSGGVTPLETNPIIIAPTPYYPPGQSPPTLPCVQTGTVAGGAP